MKTPYDPVGARSAPDRMAESRVVAMSPRSLLFRLAGLLLLGAIAFVSWQAGVTLMRLEQVERERDTWQRPRDIIDALAVGAGSVVVDIGSGSGYFAVRLAPVVGPAGRVIAVDVQRQPLVFLSVRQLLRRDWQIEVVLGEEDDPHLGAAAADAALIVNTYHELTAPAATLSALTRALKPGGRLVVVDRGPRAGRGPSRQEETAHHTLSPDTAESEIVLAGFERVDRRDSFIDRPGDEPWWLMVFTKR